MIGFGPGLRMTRQKGGRSYEEAALMQDVSLVCLVGIGIADSEAQLQKPFKEKKKMMKIICMKPTCLC
jgi:hypothetical protein